MGRSDGWVVPGYDWGSARMRAITHTVCTGGGLGDEEHDEEQEHIQDAGKVKLLINHDKTQDHADRQVE